MRGNKPADFHTKNARCGCMMLCQRPHSVLECEGKTFRYGKGNRSRHIMESKAVPSTIGTRTRRHTVNGVQLMSSMVILIAIASVIAMCVHNGYDNDIWFILATGRQIAEHGIPYTNPFSVYPGMAFVAQQWLVCLVDWLTWSASGFVGLGVLLLVTCVALLIAMRHAALSAAGADRLGFVALCLMLLTVSAASSYVSFRPQVITMTLMMLTISVMERYRKTGNTRTLGWLLPITIMHANLHMSMMWMDVAIVCCYALPSARSINRFLAWVERGYRRLAIILDDDNVEGTETTTSSDDTRPTTWRVQLIEDGYKRVPVLKAIAMMLVATCVNPYGISGAMYLFNSYGAAGYGNYISEMGKVTPMSASYGILLIACIVIAAIAIGKRGIRRMDLPMLLIVLGTIPVSLANVRSVWILPVISLPYVIKTLGTPKADNTYADGIGTFELLRNIILIVTVTICAFLAVVSTQSLSGEQYQDDSSTPITAMETLDNIYDESQRGDIKICTMFNLGGFVEYHGYRVSMDPRPETWQDSISHDGNDRYTTYVDAANSVSDADSILASCDFDYVLVSSGSTLKQEAERKGYTEVVSGVGYVLLGKNGS